MFNPENNSGLHQRLDKGCLVDVVAVVPNHIQKGFIAGSKRFFHGLPQKIPDAIITDSISVKLHILDF